MIFLKESTFSKTFDEDERMNYWKNLIIQCNNAAADEWKK